MTPTESKALVLNAVKQLLQPLGFRKSAGLFLRTSEDVLHLIEVQASRKNTASKAEFTVNIGVFVPDLIYPDIRDVTKPSIPGAHWRERIGFLSPEQKDIWWPISSQAQGEAAAKDIVNRIQDFALPALAELQNLEALAALWQTGKSPGITQYERQENLARLKEL